jgi:hypothetical protein
MIQFKLNGKKIQVASCWEDLTFNQYCEIFKIGGDLLKLVSLVSGTDYEILKKAKIEGVEALVAALAFIKKPAVWTNPTLKCGPYTLPVNKNGTYNIQYESLGQFEDMRALMNRIRKESVLKDMQDITPDIVAIYLQKIRDGEYSPDKAQAMIEEIKTYPAQEVVTLGSFFIVKLSNLLTGTPDNSQTTPQSLKKSKPVLKGSNRRSARSQRSRK